MTENPVSDALDKLGDSLNKVDAARHTLLSILEDLGLKPSAHVVSCVSYTLESAVEQGQASLDIVNKDVRVRLAAPTV